MTALRDALLKKALEYAPDSGLAPVKSVGDAIKSEAVRAVLSRPTHPRAGLWARLRAWWLPPGHVPWNAAFASLLLASLVTLLWRGEAPPGAEPETVRGLPAAAVSPTPPTPSEAPPEKTLQPAQPTPKAEAPRVRLVAPAVTAPPPVDYAANNRLADAAPAAPARPEAPPLSSSVPVPAPAEAVAVTPQAPAMRAAPVAAAAPAAKAMAPLLGRAERSGVPAEPAARATWDGWTELRVTAAGRTDRVLRSASPGWEGVLQRLVAVAVTAEPLGGVPTLQVDLLQGGVPLGRLELAAPWVRWTPAGGDSRTGQAEAALLGDLQALLAAADSAR